MILNGFHETSQMSTCFKILSSICVISLGRVDTETAHTGIAASSFCATVYHLFAISEASKGIYMCAAVSV